MLRQLDVEELELVGVGVGDGDGDGEGEGEGKNLERDIKTGFRAGGTVRRTIIYVI